MYLSTLGRTPTIEFRFPRLYSSLLYSCAPGLSLFRCTSTRTTLARCDDPSRRASRFSVKHQLSLFLLDLSISVLPGLTRATLHALQRCIPSFQRDSVSHTSSGGLDRRADGTNIQGAFEHGTDFHLFSVMSCCSLGGVLPSDVGLVLQLPEPSGTLELIRPSFYEKMPMDLLYMLWSRTRTPPLSSLFSSMVPQNCFI
jgi:hypothetical protein